MSSIFGWGQNVSMVIRMDSGYQSSHTCFKQSEVNRYIGGPYNSTIPGIHEIYGGSHVCHERMKQN